MDRNTGDTVRLDSGKKRRVALIRHGAPDGRYIDRSVDLIPIVILYLAPPRQISALDTSGVYPSRVPFSP